MALGTTAAIVSAIVGASAVGAGVSIYEGQKSRTAAKKSADAASQATAKAKSDLEAAQASASSQAAAAVRQRRQRIASAQTIYTNPLGIGGTATLAKKKLLGQ